LKTSFENNQDSTQSSGDASPLSTSLSFVPFTNINSENMDYVWREPLMIRALPYQIHFTDIILPFIMSPDEFLSQWSKSNRGSTVIKLSNPSNNFNDLNEILSNSLSFYKIGNLNITQNTPLLFFNNAYSGISWFNDIILFVVSTDVSSSTSSDKQLSIKFEVRCSSMTVLAEIQEHLKKWMKQLTSPLEMVGPFDPSSFFKC